LFFRILGRAGLVSIPATLSPLLTFAAFFLAANILKRFAVSARNLPLEVLGFLLLGSTVGVLSSFISFAALFCNRLGTRLTL
jgi:hypothetical protein